MQRSQIRSLGVLIILINLGSYTYASIIHQSYDTFINDIIFGLLDSQGITRKEVVQKFCKQSLNNRYLRVDGDTGMAPLHYDARQSVFLLLICTHAGVSPDHFDPNLVKHYTKTRNLQNLGIVCTNEGNRPLPSGCVPGCSYTEGSLNTCNRGHLTEKVFTTIQNDISNIGLAHAYGLVIGLDNGSKKESDRANELYFKRSNSMLYNESFPHFPRTHNYLTSYLSNLTKLMKKTDIINAEKIQKIGEKKKDTDCLLSVILTNDGNLDNDKYRDMRGCTYSPSQIFSQTQGDIGLWISSMYNELVWYRLFARWYGTVLAHDLRLSRTDKTDNVSRQISQLAFESNQAFRSSEQAATLMQSVIRTINSVRYTFPIHIGLLAYHESVVGFRNVMAKLYTPIHQLGYKITNAQAKMY